MANYQIVHENKDWITLRDSENKITKDPDRVIKELHQMLNSRRLYFIDKDGNFGRLLYEGNKFLNYSDK